MTKQINKIILLVGLMGSGKTQRRKASGKKTKSPFC